MKKDNKKPFNKKTKATSSEGIGVRTDNPLDPAKQYAGDSVNEHKEMEQANEHFADEEIEQVNNNL